MTQPAIVVQDHPKSWYRDGYLISTDPSMISISALKAAFDSKELAWTTSFPEAALRDMVQNSLCFGLYTATPSLGPATVTPSLEHTNADGYTGVQTKSPEDPASTLHEIAESLRPPRPGPPQRSESDVGEHMIGFARLITDRVSIAYLTDVYVLPEWQGQGLGKWLISCVQEALESMPYRRGSFLMVERKNPHMKKFYEDSMHVVGMSETYEALYAQGPMYPR